MTDLARLRQLVAGTDNASDADLLDRFVVDRDGPAFASLVRRHGPMVLAVCRRVLRHRQDAEDAFQATFLVLARQAEAMQPRSALGNWLYGVAYRTALGARRAAAVRREREARAAAMWVGETFPDDGLAPELREALDRELAALPNVYRAAVVACDLEGLARREAAVRLGWTEGTLSSRLARARRLLARRLSRYGLEVPAVGLVPVTGLPTIAAELADPTIRLSVLVAAGDAVVAAPVAALMEGTMRTMLLTKLKTAITTAVVVCAVAVVSTAGWRANTAIADSPKAADAPKTESPTRGAPNPDKARIAELERERDQLRKEVAELRDRLVVAAQHQRATASAMKEATLTLLLKQNEARPEVLEPGPNSLLPKPGLKDLGAGTSGVETGPKLRKEAAQDQPKTAQMEVRVYAVGKLAGDEKEGEALAKVLRATVEPNSWGTDAGSIEFFAGRLVLVVRQTQKGHDGVAELLKLLQPQKSEK